MRLSESERRLLREYPCQTWFRTGTNRTWIGVDIERWEAWWAWVDGYGFIQRKLENVIWARGVGRRLPAPELVRVLLARVRHRAREMLR